MIGLTLFAAAALFLLATVRWRQGIYLAILVAFLQDPLRKLAPDQPAYFNLFCGLIFTGAAIGAFMSKVPLAPNAMSGWRKYLAAPFAVYAVWVLFQAGRSLLEFGQPMVPALGLISYVGPFFALVVAYQFFARGGPASIESVMRFYLVVAFPCLITVFLQAAGVVSPVFGEVGEGIHISTVGGILTANSGTFRASEIAAWHAGTVGCIAILLMTVRKTSLAKIAAYVLVVGVSIAMGVLTGRRKFLVMMAIFALSYLALVLMFERRRRAFSLGALASGVGVYLAGAEFVGDAFKTLSARSGDYSDYVDRMSTVFGDVPTRFVDLGIAPVTWAFDDFGFLGAGLGVGTQGVANISPIVAQSSGAAEGGLGKVTVELGIPGLFIVGALGVCLVRHLWRILGYVSQVSAPLTRLGCGMVALLVANAASFSIATQTYGDIFVLMFLGLLLGAVMALPVFAGFVAQSRARAQHREAGARLVALPSSAGR